MNVAMEGKSVQRAQMWQDKLIAALNNNRSRERYVMVSTDGDTTRICSCYHHATP